MLGQASIPDEKTPFPFHVETDQAALAFLGGFLRDFKFDS